MDVTNTAREDDVSTQQSVVRCCVLIGNARIGVRGVVFDWMEGFKELCVYKLITKKKRILEKRWR